MTGGCESPEQRQGGCRPMALPQGVVDLDGEPELDGQGLDGFDAATCRTGQDLLDPGVVEMVPDARGLSQAELVQRPVAVVASGLTATCVCVADEVDRHRAEEPAS